MKLPLWIAARYLRSRPRTGFITLLTGISIAGVAVGVTALLTVLAVMNGFESEVQTRISGTDAHVVLLGENTSGVPNGESLAAKLAAQPGVEGVAAFTYAKAMAFRDGASEGMVVKGVDLAAERTVTTIGRHIVPALDSIPAVTLGGEPGIVLGSELAARLGAGIGDVVLLATLQGDANSAFGYAPKLRPFRVVGQFTSGLYNYDSSLGFTSIATSQKFFDLGQNVTGVEVKLTDMFTAPEAAVRLLRAADQAGLRANNWIELNRNLFTWMKLEKAVMFVILGLIVLVAAFNIVSTLFMVVLEKRRDIGVLKSLGATPEVVLQIFLVEGLLIGGLGTLAGTILGAGLIYVLKRWPFVHLPGDVYFIETLPVRPEAGDFAAVILAAIALCLAAAWYPAWQASRLDPVAAIRRQT
ncbi:MAG: ABC transporter permease [Candidatus Eisenbacteria bacterium]|uniref:ABC transporter permease n=1 Tax=Eiseniibacteriota bacterium TaxID=2212470 RepID=A0A933SAF2_UNCEI|nr:ABC transporter permease [Candidatus Eisenbacteria bacterium]